MIYEARAFSYDFQDQAGRTVVDTRDIVALSETAEWYKDGVGFVHCVRLFTRQGNVLIILDPKRTEMDKILAAKGVVSE